DRRNLMIGMMRSQRFCPCEKAHCVIRRMPDETDAQSRGESLDELMLFDAASAVAVKARKFSSHFQGHLSLAERNKDMPKKKTIERARDDEREGKSPSTQAGEFVREEIELIRKGAHGARSTKQAIAIGLSKARRAGVKLPPPQKGTVPDETREKA